MLIELLRPGGPELMRRWVAALLLAPRTEREGIVGEVERRLVELYAEPLTGGAVDDKTDDADVSDEHTTDQASSCEADSEEAPTMHVVSEAVQRDGYIERVERAYSPAKKAKAKKKSSSKTGNKRRA